MVTALRFGKPVPHTSSSTKGKEENDGGGSGKSRHERERDTAAATATAAAIETASNKSDNFQKAAHNQRRQNLNSSSAMNHVQFASSSASASSTQLKVLPLSKNNTYAATQTQPGQKIQNGESGPFMPTNRTSWRSMMHDKAKRSINSNGGSFRVSAPPPSAAAPTNTKALVAKHEMSEEEEWIKTFKDVREYQYQHGHLPTSGWDKGKSVEEVDLIKWMDLQRYLYQKYLEGRKSALSHTRIDLLRSIGMIDKAVSNVESKRMCMFWGCKRALGEFESFHCAEHMNVNTAALAVGDPSTYNTSKRAVKRRKTNPKESSSKSSSNPPANGTKHTLKSPPEEMLKNVSNPEETTNIKEDEDDLLNMVKLAAGAVAKEIRYLGLQSSSSTDHVESAIERFAVEVYCPLLYSSKERSVGTSSYSADRVLLSTLLALQEMLVTNAEKFFPLAELKGSSTEKDNDEEANSKLTRDFARALVQNAAKRLQRTSPDVSLTHIIPNQDRLVDRYLEASRRYESRGEDFQLALGRLDASATYRNAKGSTLSKRESIMARTSFNFAREHHPLVRENDMVGGQAGAQPAPNACAIFVVGEGKRVQKEDTMQTSAHNLEARHQKRTKVRESRIRLLKRYFGGPS